MRTAVVSDLHLGTRLRIDRLREPEAQARFLELIEDADQLVLLGDTLELRDRPARQTLEQAGPFLDAVGRVMREGRVVLVPGNHDHRLARESFPDRLTAGFGPVQVRRPGGPLARALAERLGAETVLAYPGFQPAPGTWLTHGHYVDAHSAAQTLETVLAAAQLELRPSLRRSGPRAARDYERVLQPSYRLFEGIAEFPRLQRAADLGKRLVRRAEVRTGGRRSDDPAGVDAPVTPEPHGRRLTTAPGELRRPGVLPMAEVVRRLGVGAGTVLFGHTHRIGPVGGDDPAVWHTAGGVALWNTGSWVGEAAFARRDGVWDAYRPGVVTVLDAGGAVEGQRRAELH